MFEPCVCLVNEKAKGGDEVEIEEERGDLDGPEGRAGGEEKEADRGGAREKEDSMMCPRFAIVIRV